jgi:hypothetical protein
MVEDIAPGEPPVFRGGFGFESGGSKLLKVILLPVVVCLSFCRWAVTDGIEQSAMV